MEKIAQLCKARFPEYRFEPLKGRGKELPYIRITFDLGQVCVNIEGMESGNLYDTEFYNHDEFVDIMSHMTRINEVIIFIQCKLREVAEINECE